MARKFSKKDNRYLAKLVTENRAPCAFCHRNVDDEATYGKLYAIGEIQCHYFCALLSCCLIQKGSEEEGLFGFMYKDILAELERSKKHKCSFCGKGGANLGCSTGSCRKQFHLPCGRERNAVSLYYGTFKSYCQAHAPKQRIPDHIMLKAKLRIKYGAKKNDVVDDDSTEDDMVCVICYEAVDAYPTVNTFWPPCCAKDAWFHRSCLQRMALSAGMHYLKCPLCNDKNNFYEAVINQGYYVPDRDAAWELEQNAFAEIYERPLTCTAEVCHCPLGRSHDSDQGIWDMKLCLLCGSVGCHAGCTGASETTRYVCLTCTPAAPQDLQALADTIEKMILQEQAAAARNERHGPVMPSRMSLRRTKGIVTNKPSTSRSNDDNTQSQSPAPPNIQASRQELNLKSPRRPTRPTKTESPTKSIYTTKNESPLKLKYYNSSESPYKSIKPNSYKNSELYNSLKENILSPIKLLNSINSYKSPLKIIEQRLSENVGCMGGDYNLDEKVVGTLRRKFKKPRPLCVRKRIVNEILDGLFDNITSAMRNNKLGERVTPTKQNPEGERAANENETKDANNTAENKGNPATPNSKRIVTTPNKLGNTPKSSIFNIEHVDTIVKISKSKLSIETLRDIENNENEFKNNSKDTNENLKDTQTVKDNDDITKDIDKDTKSIEENLPDGNNTKDNLTEGSSNLKPLPEVTETDKSDIAIEPKRKTIEIKQDSSLEISELEHSVNIDVIKVIKPVDKKTPDPKCAFKFSAIDKEMLEYKNIGIDMESFKMEYLSEVGKEFKCCFNHKHDNTAVEKPNFRTAIDFAIDAKDTNQVKEIKSGKKRKVSEGNLEMSSDKIEAKKRKMSVNDLDLCNEYKTEKELVEKAKVSDKELIKHSKVERKCRRKDKNRNRIGNQKKTRSERIEMDGKEKQTDLLGNEVIKKRGKENIQKNRKTLPYRKSKKDIKRDKAKCVNTDKDIENSLQDNDRIEVPTSILSDNIIDLCSEVKSKDFEDKPQDMKVKTKTEKQRKDRLKNKLRKRLDTKRNSDKLKRKYNKETRNDEQNLEVTINSSRNKMRKKKDIKTKLSFNSKKDISVKIKLKKERLRLKIKSKKVKEEKVETELSKFKQYVLQYFAEATPREVLVKPEKEVSALKRKYVRQDKTPDNLKQTSIQNYFKIKSPN